MIACDYHLHCSISPDSKEEIRVMCDSAIGKGLEEVMFTDHFEFFHDRNHSKIFNESYLEGAYRLIMQVREEYQGRLQVGYGIELGQMQLQQEWAHDILSRYPFDFVLASVHKIDDVDLALHDYSVPEQEREQLLDRYLDDLMSVACYCDYDSLAHLDLIRRYSAKAGRPVLIESREEKVRRILRTVADKGRAIEINTSGLRGPAADTLPGNTILSWFAEEGGRYVSIGSDAHRKEDVAYGFDKLTLPAGSGLKQARYNLRRRI